MMVKYLYNEWDKLPSGIEVVEDRPDYRTVELVNINKPQKRIHVTYEALSYGEWFQNTSDPLEPSYKIIRSKETVENILSRLIEKYLL